MSGLSLIGDPAKGRPTLGATAPVAMFRALRLVGVMEGIDHLIGDASNLVYASGKTVGTEVGKGIVKESGPDLGKFVEVTARTVKDLGVGLLSVVSAEPEKGRVALRVDECITCSGMPNIGKKVCHFEGGLISGVVSEFVNKPVTVVETKCNGMGSGCCEFECTW